MRENILSIAHNLISPTSDLGGGNDRRRGKEREGKRKKKEKKKKKEKRKPSAVRRDSLHVLEQ